MDVITIKNIIIISNTNSFQNIGLINSKFVSEFKSNLIFCDNVSPASLDYFPNIFSIFNGIHYQEKAPTENKLMQVLHRYHYNTQVLFSSDEIGVLFEENADWVTKYNDLYELKTCISNLHLTNKSKPTLTFIEFNDENYHHDLNIDQIEDELYKRIIKEDLKDFIVLYVGNITSNSNDIAICRVPIFFVMPEVCGYPHYCNELVRITDIFPTILSLLEISHPSNGASLLPLFKGEEFRCLPAIIDTSSLENGVTKTLILKNNNREYQIMWDENSQTYKVFDLVYDPACSTDLVKI